MPHFWISTNPSKQGIIATTTTTSTGMATSTTTLGTMDIADLKRTVSLQITSPKSEALTMDTTLMQRISISQDLTTMTTSLDGTLLKVMCQECPQVYHFVPPSSSSFSTQREKIRVTSSLGKQKNHTGFTHRTTKSLLAISILSKRTGSQWQTDSCR